MEAVVVAQHRRHEARRAVGRRGDDATARRVLLVHRQSPEVHPVQRRQRVGDPLVGVGYQRLMHLEGAPLHLQAARQYPVRAHAAVDAGVHGGRDLIEAGVDARVVSPYALVGAHQLGDGQVGAGRHLQELGARVEGEGDLDQGRGLRRGVQPHLALVPYETAADGEVVALRDEITRGVEGGEPERVGMWRQAGAALPEQVGGLVEADAVAAGQIQPPIGADVGHDPVGLVRIEPARLEPGQPQDHRAVRGVASARQRQGRI